MDLGSSTSRRFVVRPAQRADEQAVSELLGASYARLFPQFYPADVLKRALPFITRANPELLTSGLYHVSEGEDGRLVGCGGWSIAHPATRTTEPGIGHIRHFATHPDWTGLGIGRAIYLQCEMQAISRRISHFTCWSSLNGQSFYAALGFSVVRPVEPLIAGTVAFPSIEMTRSLTPKP